MSLAPYFLASLRRQALATGFSVAAIALGVALGVAVSAVNRAAVDEFAQGLRTVSGQADLEVRAGRGGFDEALYGRLARLPGVAAASPVIELDAKVEGRAEPLRVLGIDPFRAVELAPALAPFAQGSDSPLEMLQDDALFLSPAAADWLGVEVGGALVLQSGLAGRPFRVAGLLPALAGSQRLAVMDIAAAQWRLDRPGVLSRIDLRLAAGASPHLVRQQIEALLPPGVQAMRPDEAHRRQEGLSRAYRVNLNMLAMIALFTGALLVFAAQALGTVRRRSQLAYLRAAGLTRRQLGLWLCAEGAGIGLAGASLGLPLGLGIASLALRALGGDLGAGYFAGGTPALVIAPWSLAGFLLLGVGAATLGALVPALEAARAAPATALKAGDVHIAPSRARPWPGLALIAAGTAAAWLPPVAGLPVFGYVSVALLLVGAVALLPSLARLAFAALPAEGGAAWQLALGSVRNAPAHAVAAAAGILASAALASSMAIMVDSFRHSLDAWLRHVLPAELYVRAARAGNTAFLDEAAQRQLRALPGVARVEFIRHQSVLVDPARPPLSVIARDLPPEARRSLPLVAEARQTDGALPPVWASEAVADLYGWRPGDRVELPLGGRRLAYRVAGIWRDYARQHGAVLMAREDYRAATGDALASEAGLWLSPGHEHASVAQAVRRLPGGERLEVAEPAAIRAVSLAIFDRTFAVTYALEAVAVAIGLAGVAASFATLASLRRREFGMLRHLGLTPGGIARMLAIEAALVTGLGLAAGLVAGLGISLVLVHVINRQSFHWSMDMALPAGPLALFALALLALAAVAALVSARAVMQANAVRAVREDW